MSQSFFQLATEDYFILISRSSLPLNIQLSFLTCDHFSICTGFLFCEQNFIKEKGTTDLSLSFNTLITKAESSKQIMRKARKLKCRKAKAQSHYFFRFCSLSSYRQMSLQTSFCFICIICNCNKKKVFYVHYNLCIIYYIYIIFEQKIKTQLSL